MSTLADVLGRSCRRAPERPAIVEAGERLIYGELERRALRRAAALGRLGVEAGTPVALLLPNGADYVVSYLAILAAGGIVVPLDGHYSAREIAGGVEATGARVCVTSAAKEPLCRTALEAAGGRCEVWVAGGADEPEGGAERLAAPAAIGPETPAMFQFSSGSTGAPKLVARSHARLVRELAALREVFELSPADRFLGAAPFSHVNGLVRTMLASLAAGGTLHPLPAFGRREVAATIEREAITVFIGVPFMFSALAGSRYRRRPDWSSLRLAVSASAPMPPERNRAFHEAFGLHVRQLYGSTETGTISVNLDADISATLGSVGRPIPGVEVEVLAEDSTPLGPDEAGEVAVRSALAIERYAGPEEAGRSSFRDGFFLTGDIGRKDGEDRLYLLGRKKFLINRGGYKVNPQEVEEVLETHPAVRELAVVGEPTALGDERVKAIVVAAPGCDAAALIAYCRGKMADFKVPSVIEFREALPRSATGKLRRGLL